MENSKLRVIHKSLIFDAVKEGKGKYLGEVLSALEEKYKKKESRVKLMLAWLSSKLCCGKTKENQSADDTLVAYLQELEDAHVRLARKTAEASNHGDIRRELQDMKDRVGDLKIGVLTGYAKKETPLWDTTNEEGDTCLHISTYLNKPKATRRLLKAGADVNIENAKGETALHNACRNRAIDEATSLIEKGANLVLNKKNETPALNLLFENQDIEKVKNLMAAIHTSNDKVMFLKKIFQEDRLLFKMKNPALIRSVVDTDEPDEDLARFVNLQDPTNNNNTGLHLACQRSCQASASWLLKAGGYKLKANGDAFTPNLETFFTKEKSSKITDFLVRGLIEKASMNLLQPEEAIEYLQMKQTGGASLLNLVEDRSWFDKLAAVNGVGVEIAEFAPTMGAQFADWLLAKAEQEDWEKEYVYEHLLILTPWEGKIALAHFTDSIIYDKVAEVVRAKKMTETASYMGLEFAQWLLSKAEKEGWDKNAVHQSLMKKNKNGKSSYDRLNLVDSSGWNRVACAVGVKIAELAPTMGAQFADWLLIKTEQEDWEKKSVYKHLLELNRKGEIALAHFTESSDWNKVAEVVEVKEIAGVASYMGPEFADWLRVKTGQEGWDRGIVYSCLIKVNDWGKIALVHFTDSSVWNMVAEVVGSEEMAKLASYMGAEFADWMLAKVEEENFDKETVNSHLIKVNDWGKTALAHFPDSRTWEKVAAVVGHKIAESASAMGPESTLR